MAAHESVAVTALIDGLKHPLIAEVRDLRGLILGVDPAIRDEVKWNSPSFYTTEHFATMRLNGKVPLQLILHLGAKRQSIAPGSIDDPAGLLKWLGPDRAVIDIPDAATLQAACEPLHSLLRQWLKHLPKTGAGP